MAEVRDVDEDVEVLVDGDWRFGVLSQWRHDAEGWVGFVRYRTAPSKGYVGWFPADRIRQA